jgi:hypothetical protein
MYLDTPHTEKIELSHCDTSDDDHTDNICVDDINICDISEIKNSMDASMEKIKRHRRGHSMPNMDTPSLTFLYLQKKKLDSENSKRRQRNINVQLGLTPDLSPVNRMSPINRLHGPTSPYGVYGPPSPYESRVKVSPHRSPAGETLEDRLKDMREEIKFKRQTFWKSCCGQVLDRRAIVFFVQVFIGFTVMAFCMVKIWTSEQLDCTGEDTTAYFSLLSALVGFYIPSPSMEKK